MWCVYTKKNESFYLTFKDRVLQHWNRTNIYG
jgi:hypothetical protein